MKRTPPKSYHHGGLRQALVEAGRAILEEEGAAALTLRACARRAGVSHAAPQHHFATASDLLAEIAATGFEDFVAAIAGGAAASQRSADKLKAMGRAYVAFAQSRPAIYDLMFGPKLGAHSRHLQDAMVAAWTQLAAGVADVAGSADVDAKAAHVWSLVHGFAMLTNARRFPPHVAEDRALDIMLESLPQALGGAG
jgi:AcrR family transcriptional regulator